MFGKTRDRGRPPPGSLLADPLPPRAVAGFLDAVDLAGTHDATVHALYAADMPYSYDFDAERLIEILECEGERTSRSSQ